MKDLPDFVEIASHSPSLSRISSFLAQASSKARMRW